MSELAYGLIH